MTEKYVPNQAEYWDKNHQQREDEFNNLAQVPNPFAVRCIELLNTGDWILDLGSSTGRDSRYFSKVKSCTCFAVDISALPLKKLLSYTNPNKLTTYPVNASITHLPFPNDPLFNAIYARSSLHLSDSELINFLELAHNLLKTNGFLMIQGKPIINYKLTRSKKIDENLYLDIDGHLRRSWNLDESTKLLQTSDFQLIESGITTEIWQEKETIFTHYILKK